MPSVSPWAGTDLPVAILCGAVVPLWPGGVTPALFLSCGGPTAPLPGVSGDDATDLWQPCWVRMSPRCTLPSPSSHTSL